MVLPGHYTMACMAWGRRGDQGATVAVAGPRQAPMMFSKLCDLASRTSFLPTWAQSYLTCCDLYRYEAACKGGFIEQREKAHRLWLISRPWGVDVNLRGLELDGITYLNMSRAPLKAWVALNKTVSLLPQARPTDLFSLSGCCAMTIPSTVSPIATNRFLESFRRLGYL